MASIVRRRAGNGAVRWQAKVRRGSVRISATFGDKAAAQQWAKGQEGKADLIRANPSGSQGGFRTLGELIDRYERERLPGFRDTAGPTRFLQFWRRELGAYALNEVHPALVADLRLKLEGQKTTRGKRRPQTVLHYLNTLSALFNFGIKSLQWTDSNPVQRITKPRPNNSRVRWLENSERAALLEACKRSGNAYLHPVVTVLLATGCRYGEVINLRWQDVNLKAGTAHVERTKTGKPKVIHLIGPTLDVLQGLHAERNGSDWCFPGPKRNGPVDLRSAWRVARKRAKLGDFRMHDLRHDCASRLVSSGVDLRAVAGLLGHSQVSTTMRYAHLSPAGLRDVAAKAAASL